jgi:hypothetical protein
MIKECLIFLGILIIIIIIILCIKINKNKYEKYENKKLYYTIYNKISNNCDKLIIKNITSSDIFDDKIGVVMPTFGRPEYVNESLESLRKSDLSKVILFIVDETSTKTNTNEINNEINNILNNFNINIPLVIIFKKTHGNMFDSFKTAMDILIDVFKVKKLMTIDSDAIVKHNWINKLCELYDKNISNPSIISGFNTLSHDHVNITEKDTYFIKKSIGGINMLFSDLTYKNIVRPTLIDKRWDWNICKVINEKKGLLICTKPSVVNHIGKIGYHASNDNYDVSFDFDNQNLDFEYSKTPKELRYIVKNNPTINELKSINGVLYVVFICWFGSTISENRKNALLSLIKNIGVPYILITDDNVYSFQVKNKPYNKAFYFLSGNHKSDYLRSYLLHNYGGGYHDIKYRNISWVNEWNDFKNKNIWIKSRHETRHSHIGYDIDNPKSIWIQDKYSEIGTMGWVICRAQTNYTKELLTEIEKTLNKHYFNLVKNPSKTNGGYYSDKPFNKVNDPENNYPMRWLEIMGEKFHLLMYKYRDNMILNLPDADLRNYK